MSKRFVDTDLWQKEWFQCLKIKHKILLKYIFENCDCAGFWIPNFSLASFLIGEAVTIEDVKFINKYKKQFEILSNGTIFVFEFIQFQYGKLSESCKPHKPVIEKLKKYNLYEKYLKFCESGQERFLEAEQHNPEKNEKKQKLYGKYQNVLLNAEQYNRLLGICASQKLLDELVDSLSENIEQGKEQPYKAEFPNAHFVRLQKYREFRLKNPDKFREKQKSKVANVIDDLYKRTMERRNG